MKNYLSKLPQEFRDFMHLAGDTATLRNMHVYLVGGFVRDLLLGVKNLDLDLVVEGDGIVFAEDLAAKLKARLVRHRQFGTATVIWGHHFKVDVATARKEIYLRPAALPEVEFGTLRDDLKRRDFTINAIAIDISHKDFGSLIDYFKGREDLVKKKIRILHNASFIDDPTRILRAIRFEQRYNFKIEPDTLKLLKDAVKSRMLEVIEPQRLRNELIFLLRERNPVQQIKRISELFCFSFIKTGFCLTKNGFVLLKEVEKQITWFNKTHAKRRPVDKWLLYFMALVDYFDLGETQWALKKLVFRKGEEKRILDYKSISKKFIAGLSKKGLKASEIFELLEPLSYEVMLLIKARYKNPALEKHIEDFLEIYSGMRIFVSGHDLHHLGVKPGPDYQKIFAKVLNAKLNGKINTYDEELLLIKKLIKDIK